MSRCRSLGSTSENWTSTRYEYRNPGSEFRPGFRIEWKDADGAWEYDEPEFDMRVVDAEGRCTYYQHDSQGRVILVLYPTSVYEQIEYYPSGRLRARWSTAVL